MRLQSNEIVAKKDRKNPFTISGVVFYTVSSGAGLDA